LFDQLARDKQNVVTMVDFFHRQVAVKFFQLCFEKIILKKKFIDIQFVKLVRDHLQKIFTLPKHVFGTRRITVFLHQGLSGMVGR
jgi:hypothetical protein